MGEGLLIISREAAGCAGGGCGGDTGDRYMYKSKERDKKSDSNLDDKTV